MSRRHWMTRVCLVLGTACLLIAPGRGGWAQAAFPLRDGDTWVMVGDSITAQHLHTNYIEAFCYARFPRWNFRFRNSGVGGDRVPTALERWNWDVARWHPTVVSVELGMNDAGAGAGSAASFRADMLRMLEQIRLLAARPVWIAPSPVNDGSGPVQWKANPGMRNAVLDAYAAALAETARDQRIPYADQFHVLSPVWSRNTSLMNVLSGAQVLSTMPGVPGVEQLKAWLKAYEESGSPPPVSLQGDPVHPGPPGQLMMAAAILSQLQAPGLVSQATIDAAGAGKVVEARQCGVTDLRVGGGAVTFTRRDDCLPFPIPEDARTAVDAFPPIRALSQYMLVVKGLKDGNYVLKIDDVPVATLTNAQLIQGFNLAMLERGPIAEQCRSILEGVRSKETLVGQWRSASRQAPVALDGELRNRLLEIDEQIRESDGRLRTLAQPRPHRFSLAPAQ